MKDVKIIANYLPQYHSIPENDLWWGEGYTDWVAVKKSTPLYPGHIQPKVPMGENYYDLSRKENIQWQAELAKAHNVFGFGIYHYWFSNEQMLLGKPAQIILENKDIDIHFMFIWDNGSWKRTWSKIKGFANDWAPNFEGKSQDQTNGVLAELVYGDEKDWRVHFDYLLPFFKDDRYIKLDGKPMFGFFNQYNEPEVVARMCACWDKWAKEEGLPGICALGRRVVGKDSLLTHQFDYDPHEHGWLRVSFVEKVINKLKKITGLEGKHPQLFDYDTVWKRLLKEAEDCNDQSLFYGSFVDFDDSPRRGAKGKIMKGGTPEKFGNYLGKLIDICRRQKKEYVFLTAWNEWGEGAYMEPDNRNGNRYLEALKQATEKDLM